MVTEKLFDMRVGRRGLLMAAGAFAAAGSLGFPRFVFGVGDDFPVFMKTSLFLTGMPELNPVLGRKIFTALSMSDKGFVKNMLELDKYISTSGVKAEDLQAGLDKGGRPYASVPKKIAKAWYLGVVGEGKNAVAVSYENALMFAPVAGIAVIPSYATGAYGSWVNPPEAAGTGG